MTHSIQHPWPGHLWSPGVGREERRRSLLLEGPWERRKITYPYRSLSSSVLSPQGSGYSEEEVIIHTWGRHGYSLVSWHLNCTRQSEQTVNRKKRKGMPKRRNSISKGDRTSGGRKIEWGLLAGTSVTCWTTKGFEWQPAPLAHRLPHYPRGTDPVWHGDHVQPGVAHHPQPGSGDAARTEHRNVSARWAFCHCPWPGSGWALIAAVLNAPFLLGSHQSLDLGA